MWHGYILHIQKQGINESDPLKQRIDEHNLQNQQIFKETNSPMHHLTKKKNTTIVQKPQ